MDFIRSQQANESDKPGTYDGRTAKDKEEDGHTYKHCFVGDDADFVFLGLAIKTPGVCVLRNDLRRKKQAAVMADVAGWRKGLQIREAKKQEPRFALLDLDHMRQRLIESLLKDAGPAVANSFDSQRGIADTVLLSCLIGNDMVPMLPMMDVRDNSMDKLINVYRGVANDTNAGTWKHLTTEDGKIIARNVIDFFQGLEQRDIKTTLNLFQRRTPTSYLTCPGWQNSECSSPVCEYLHGDHVPWFKYKTLVRGIITKFTIGSLSKKKDASISKVPGPLEVEVRGGTLAFHNCSKGCTRMITEFAMRNQLTWTFPQKIGGNDVVILRKKRGMSSTRYAEIGRQVMLEEFVEELARRAAVPTVSPRLALPREGEDLEAYKNDYYRSKFAAEEYASPANGDIKSRVAYEYLRGLEWVVQYYTKGICSWQWVYPFHYSPFPSELASLCANHSREFASESAVPSWDLGEPDSPIEQVSSKKESLY